MKSIALTIATLLAAGTAQAKDLNFGATLSISGPAASLGISMAKAVEVLPKISGPIRLSGQFWMTVPIQLSHARTSKS